jgi:hypothetical protein
VPEFKPIAHATKEGRIAVYLGAGYQQLPLSAAMTLRNQLDLSIAEIERMRASSTATHAAPTQQATP